MLAKLVKTHLIYRLKNHKKSELNNIILADEHARNAAYKQGTDKTKKNTQQTVATLKTALTFAIPKQ